MNNTAKMKKKQQMNLFGSCLLDVIVFQFDRDELMRG